MGRNKARCIGIGKYKGNTKETSFLLRQFHVVFAAPARVPIIASLPMTQYVLRVQSIVQVQPAKQTSRNRETQRPRVSARKFASARVRLARCAEKAGKTSRFNDNNKIQRHPSISPGRENAVSRIQLCGSLSLAVDLSIIRAFSRRSKIGARS